jgi:2-polyprenyl-3-methyl-5-hydroxy-6-metoxy-1,4-benzoquinol methylase
VEAPPSRAEAERRLAEEAGEYDARRGPAPEAIAALIGPDGALRSRYPMHARFERLVAALREGGLRAGPVLACGCGPGVYELSLARRGFEIWAYDNSSRAVAEAAANARAAGLGFRALFQANELSLARELAARAAPRFALIFGGAILHHLADPRAFASAIAPHVGDDTLGVFLEPVSGRLVDAVRRSRWNPTAAAQTHAEEVLGERRYGALLAPAFPHAIVTMRMTLFGGAQKLLSPWLPEPLAAALERPCAALDAALGDLPPLRALTWHAVILAGRRPDRLADLSRRLL